MPCLVQSQIPSSRPQFEEDAVHVVHEGRVKARVLDVEVAGVPEVAPHAQKGDLVVRSGLGGRAPHEEDEAEKEE